MYGAMAETSYQDVDFRRSVFFVRKRYFVIVDEIESARHREYRWCLHGNSKEAESKHWGGQWIVGSARLCAFNLLPTGMPYRHYLGKHTRARSRSARSDRTHVYRQTWTAGKNVLFVSVLVPDSADAAMPEVCLLGRTPVAIGVGTAESRKQDVFIWTGQGGSQRIKVPGVGDETVAGPAGLFRVDRQRTR
jgi:hypothetical protein